MHGGRVGREAQSTTAARPGAYGSRSRRILPLAKCRYRSGSVAMVRYGCRCRRRLTGAERPDGFVGVPTSPAHGQVALGALTSLADDVPVEIEFYDGTEARTLRPMHIDLKGKGGRPTAASSPSRNEFMVRVRRGCQDAPAAGHVVEHLLAPGGKGDQDVPVDLGGRSGGPGGIDVGERYASGSHRKPAGSPARVPACCIGLALKARVRVPYP